MVRETLVVLFCTVAAVNSLNNGLALTPPMGWLSWQAFRCNTDCTNSPNNCISEQLIRDMADRMAEDGYLDAGYEYIVIDDCWLATVRDSEGRLQPDLDRFPNGIAALANYVHSKGLKFGILEDLGDYTCAEYPGIGNNLELDADIFADWGVDYLKIGACNETTDIMERFVQFGVYLNKTGRPILYNCGYPAFTGFGTDFAVTSDICNSWRIYNTVQPTWDSLKDIINWYAAYQSYLNTFLGPGHWHDFDVLLVGEDGVSYDECVFQMTLWSIIPSPLFMSVDLRTIGPEFKDILLNEKAIKINQDALGEPALLSLYMDDVYLWVKKLSPVDNGLFPYAFGILSFRSGSDPYVLDFNFYDFGLDDYKYIVTNVFEDVDPVIIDPNIIPFSYHFQIPIRSSCAVLLHVSPYYP